MWFFVIDWKFFDLGIKFCLLLLIDIIVLEVGVIIFVLYIL